jgi:hypothetical protein
MSEITINVDVEAIESVVTETLKDVTEDTLLTPYKIASLYNKGVAVLSDLPEMRPQMMYNYDRNGLIVKGVKGKKLYTKTEVREWMVRYLVRKLINI